MSVKSRLLEIVNELSDAETIEFLFCLAKNLREVDRERTSQKTESKNVDN